ncbi:MAG TPA: hypothetical protein VH062_18275 [Polyangiaceae bacterium]|nr:hypothetical protein [Polyangiaceae bacterium]
MAPLLTLFGAYTRVSEPLSPRPSVVELGAVHSFAELLRGALTFSARVRVEELASDAHGIANFTRHAPGIRCRLTFGADAGTRHEAVLDGRPDRRLVRSLTELSGLVFGPDGAVVGSARLRLNWRVRR